MPEDWLAVWTFDGSACSVQAHTSSSSGGTSYFPASWMDESGALWYYEGACFANEAGALLAGDGFFKFTPSPFNSWAEVQGGYLGNGQAAYGSLGIPDPNTTPGTRAAAATWKDANGNFWLFGGGAGVLGNFDGTTESHCKFYETISTYNDMWEYVP